MPPAIIAGAIAAAGTIGAAALSSSSQSRASNQAAQTQNAATQAQVQLGRESLALNQGIYNSNYALLNPFVSRGNVAGDQINALLGLGSAPQMASPMAGGASVGSTAPTSAQPGSAPHIGFPTGDGSPVGPAYPTGMTPAQMRDYQPGRAAGMDQHPGLNGNPGYNAAPPQAVAQQAPAPQAPQAPASSVTPASASDALNSFANSAGMQFQLQQGTNALNNHYAGRGALQSGAAMQAIQNFGQHTALDNYFMPFMGLLGGQQAVGAQAGSAVAGVGSNFGNTAAQINGQMGNAINNGAQNIGNLQLAAGQNRANMFGSIGGAIGNFAGQALGSGGGFNAGASYNAANAAPWAVNLPSSAPYASMPGGLY